MQFDAISYTVYRNDSCPANSNYEGCPVTVDWASVWESPALTILYLGSYFPSPSVNCPVGNIVHSLFKYDVDVRQDSLSDLLYLIPTVRGKYVEIVRAHMLNAQANVYEYVDFEA